jgi:hypothetical protein
MPQPELPPTFTEKSLRLIGDVTVIISALTGIGVAFWFVFSGALEGSGTLIVAVGVCLGLVVFFAGALSSAWAFGAAEALGYLRRAEERELVAEWEAWQAASQATLEGHPPESAPENWLASVPRAPRHFK